MSDEQDVQPRKSDLALLASKGTHAAEPNSEIQLRDLLQTLGRLFGARGVCAYLLDTRAGAFELAEMLGDLEPVGSRLIIDGDSLQTATNSERQAAIAEAYVSREPRRAHPEMDRTSAILVIPVARKSSVVALVEFLLPADRWLASKTMNELISALQPIGWIHTAQSIRNYFEYVKTPIDFKLPRESFLESLGELILGSTGGQLAALREDVNGTLDCVEFWPSDSLTDLHSVSFPLEKYEPFLKAFQGQTTYVPDLRKPGLEALANVHALRNIRSFVTTPVFVGSETFGVLSVALSYVYEFPELMLLSIEALANGIGVSLVNYRAHHGALSLERLSEMSMLMTAVELAQSARHEALDRIDGAVRSLGVLAALVSKGGKVTGPQILKSTQSTEAYLTEAGIAIQKIQLATRPPAVEAPELLGLLDVWREVTSQLSGRLDQLDVACRQSGGQGVKIPIYRDWFRQIFLHLLLNSMDAFEAKSRGTTAPPKQGREVVLSIDAVDTKSGIVTFRYSDNAGGINPSALTGPSQFDELPIEQKIFARNITSKRGGSGWGMFLIRRVMDLHHGSIDLVRYRGGTTFRFTVPLEMLGEGELS